MSSGRPRAGATEHPPLPLDSLTVLGNDLCCHRPIGAQELVMLSLLAFLFHTVLDLRDAQHHRVRTELAIRETFLDGLQALTRHLSFDIWLALITFMLALLKLNTNSPSPPQRRAKRR